MVTELHNSSLVCDQIQSNQTDNFPQQNSSNTIIPLRIGPTQELSEIRAALPPGHPNSSHNSLNDEDRAEPLEPPPLLSPPQPIINSSISLQDDNNTNNTNPQDTNGSARSNLLSDIFFRETAMVNFTLRLVQILLNIVEIAVTLTFLIRDRNDICEPGGFRTIMIARIVVDTILIIIHIYDHNRQRGLLTKSIRTVCTLTEYGFVFYALVLIADTDAITCANSTVIVVRALAATTLIILLSPLLLLCLVCCCFPCFVRCFAQWSDLYNDIQGGASEKQLEELQTFIFFLPKDNHNDDNIHTRSTDDSFIIVENDIESNRNGVTESSIKSTLTTNTIAPTLTSTLPLTSNHKPIITNETFFTKYNAIPVEECPVCMDEYQAGDEVTVLGCHHCVHYECIQTWLKIKKTCPICRKCPFSSTNPSPPKLDQNVNVNENDNNSNNNNNILNDDDRLTILTTHLTIVHSSAMTINSTDLEHQVSSSSASVAGYPIGDNDDNHSIIIPQTTTTSNTNNYKNNIDTNDDDDTFSSSTTTTSPTITTTATTVTTVTTSPQFYNLPKIATLSRNNSAELYITNDSNSNDINHTHNQSRSSNNNSKRGNLQQSGSFDSMI